MVKKTSVLAVMAVCLMSACSSEKSETSNADAATEAADYVTPVSRKYDVKSGVIHFETSGLGMSGKKIVYFDDYGSKERVETYDEAGNMDIYNFSDGKTRYWVNLSDKTVHIADQNGSLGWEMKFPEWSEVDGRDGFKKLPNMEVAGKDCAAMQYGDNNVFAGWKGLTLYHGQKPNLEIKAVKLELDKAVDPALFKTPDGYEVKEGSYF